jgi:hypothetical protein
LFNGLQLCFSVEVWNYTNPKHDTNAEHATPDSSTNSQNSNESCQSVSFLDMKKAIHSMKSNAVGLDGIPLKFIKFFLPENLPLIAHIFIKSISSKTFSSAWKILKDCSSYENQRSV